ncbi:MAG: M3 family oligoendopeptidase [Candidatus Woesearchaeota archaeon]|jgi:oligoendopeptidase F
MAQKKNKKDLKEQKEVKEIWNLNDILGAETYENILKKVEKNIKFIENSRKLLSNDVSASVVFNLIKISEETGSLLSRAGGYYSLKSSENTKDEDALAKLSALSMISSDIETRTLFFELWFISLDDSPSKRLIESSELQKYRYFLESLKDHKPYTKSEEVEKILSIKDVTGGDSFSSLYDMHVSSYKFKFMDKKEATQEEVMSFYTSPNPKLRKKAYELIYSKYKEDSVFLSEIYKSIVLDWYNEIVKIRGYKSSISARNMSNKIDDKSVEIFLKVVRKNTPMFAEYFKLKHKILNLSGQKYEFSRVHIYAPFELKEKKYSYLESKKMVLDTFKSFDVRFYDAAKKVFDEKHIHSHPSPGKRGGAFCSSINKSITPYVLLNYTEKLRDVSTMMHELGHAVHDVFSSKQTDLLAHPKIPLAETASIFAETLLEHRLIKESKDKKEKIALLISSIDSHYQSIPRQTYLVLFEIWAHERIKEGATKKEMDDYYHSLLVEQFGEMNIPEIFDHEWNYIPHIHHTPFYTYAYAWGNLLVLAFYAMYKEQGAKFVDKYIEFLSSGASKSTTDIMLAMGANPSSEAFWQKGFDMIKEEIEELKKLTK